MAIQTLENVPWARFHDDTHAQPIRPLAEKIHCVDGLEEIIKLCANRPAGKKFKAAGSHWGLSEGALSDHEFIETNRAGSDLDMLPPRHSGFDVDLGELYNKAFFDFLVAHPPTAPEMLIEDPCLKSGPAGAFFVHIKSGTRIYRAYQLLDQGSAQVGNFAAMLNSRLAGTDNENAYSGPWAFATLGGAGGQTVFGALTTGTHGGDYKQRPISDSVAAIHLVTDGGSHFWIEPSSGRNEFAITDDEKLRLKYKNIVPGIPFDIIRDDDIFDAVVISAGRFGIVASLVLRVVPQYCLHEHRTLDDWSNLKQQLKGPTKHRFFDRVYFAGSFAEQADDKAKFVERFGDFSPIQNRFLQVAINVSPHGNEEHRCGVTQRWFQAHNAPESKNPDGSLHGRTERGIESTAGRTFPYEPPEEPNGAGSSSGTFLSKACSNGNFIAGLLRGVATEIQIIIDDGKVPAAGIAAGALAIGGGAAVLAIASICAVLVAAVALLKLIADQLEAAGDVSLAEAMNTATTLLLNNPLIPFPIALMILRTLLKEVFETQQSKRDYVALSYAVMDTHDYMDRSCFGNAESIEVFFDAAHPDVYCAYIDQILAFEGLQQEREGRVTAGYVSLRFVQGSRGLISPSRFADTLVIEVAGIRDASGSTPFVFNAANVARHPMFSAPFHWGQFNPLTRPEVERIFNAKPGTNNLVRWRAALQSLTNNGALDGFSSDFTRRTGLEPF